MGEALKKILRLGVLYKREPESIELTIEIFRQLEDLEYEGISSDKENLRKDWLRIEGDVQTGIKECKEQFEIEGKEQTRAKGRKGHYELEFA